MKFWTIYNYIKYKLNPSEDLENIRSKKLWRKTNIFVNAKATEPEAGGSAIVLPVLLYRRAKNVQTWFLVLVVCTLSDDALSFYEVSWKYLERFSSYRMDRILWQTDRQPSTKTVCLHLFQGLDITRNVFVKHYAPNYRLVPTNAITLQNNPHTDELWIIHTCLHRSP